MNGNVFFFVKFSGSGMKEARNAMTKDDTAIEGILERCGREPDKAIPVLQAIQQQFGYVPREAMEYVAQHSEISAAQLYGVVTFYSQFRLKPVGRHIVRLCHGTACYVGGAQMITDAVHSELGLSDTKDTTDDKEFTVEEVACLGCCSLAPVMMIDDKAFGKLTPKKAREVFRAWKKKGGPA